MKSRAVVMRRTGGPDVLEIEEVELPPLRSGEIRLRALASAVNHSDLEIRAGNWAIRREPRFPYVPGLEVVGDVVEVAADVGGIRIGDRGWTMMQGLGGVRAARDGGYAEHVTVSASAVAPLPRSVDPVGFAALGLAGVTAYQGLARLGSLEDLDGDGLRDATRALLGSNLPAVPHTVLPLSDAARAHDLLERREVAGRVVLVPSAAAT
jgi:NADPH:quinone reductase